MHKVSRLALIAAVAVGFSIVGCGGALEEENAELKASVAALEQENKMLNELEKD